MRILLIHNAYQQVGGEDSVLANEKKLLTSHGHVVILYAVNNSSITGLFSKLNTALNIAYSQKSKKAVADLIVTHRPDIAHVHNFFPLLTPSIFDAFQDMQIPSVLTLHNFRTICPGGFLMRDGRICEECISKSAFQSVLYGCYRNSRIETLPVAWMVETHRKRKTWQKMVDSFIVLNNFSKQKFVEAGFPENKIFIKPNFYYDQEDETTSSKENPVNRKGALFVGRLSYEKGIKTLLKAWKHLDVPLKVMGDGPLMNEFKKAALPAVTILGHKSRDEVAMEMGRAQFLIMPSEWYENFGMVIVEAFAKTLPVIASRLGSMQEIIEDRFTGLLFDQADAADLASKVKWIYDHPAECRQLGKNARKSYEEKYTPERNYEIVMGIYKETIRKRQMDMNQS